MKEEAAAAAAEAEGRWEATRAGLEKTVAELREDVASANAAADAASNDVQQWKRRCRTFPSSSVSLKKPSHRLFYFPPRDFFRPHVEDFVKDLEKEEKRPCELYL